MRRAVLALAIIIIVVLGSAVAYYLFAPAPNSSCVGGAESSSYLPTFSFGYASALHFYGDLNTTSGLYARFPGDTSIYLADDQALDYYALTGIHDSTGNATAALMAARLQAAIQSWGGFYRYYNPVLEVVGKYPNTTTAMSGKDVTIQTTSGYTIKATEFSPAPGFNYSRYADQLAYRVLLELHLGYYCSAESSFNALTGMWDGHGFVDKAFTDPNSNSFGQYQSYKLALYVIVWRALLNNQATQEFGFNNEPTVVEVMSVMSNLQNPGGGELGGGVWTGYRFTSGHIVPAQGMSPENGETTSLFILACGNARP